MTLEEKARLVNGASFFGSTAIEHKRIRRLQFLDGGTGINFEQLFGDFYSAKEDSENERIGSEALTHVIDYFYEPDKLVGEEKEIYEFVKKKLSDRTKRPNLAPGCFPPGILLGATFNGDVVRTVGEALGLEAGVYGVDILLGTPNVNILRDPLNGRFFEGYSEDPCLVSALAPNMVAGVQSQGVSANVKHFAANNQETNRLGIDVRVSMRALYEIYFPGFRACVTKGKVRTVMSAYNGINGHLCTENEWLLEDVLRKEWGFDGFVVSDWGAVKHTATALAAGNDLAMPGPLDSQPILDAIQSGALKEDKLEKAVERVLAVHEWSNQNYRLRKSELTAEEIMQKTDKAAYEAAAEGIVMLKNEDCLFPIANDFSGKIYLTGSGRELLLTCGSGSAGVTTNRNKSFVTELKTLLSEEQVIVCEEVNIIQITEKDIVMPVISVAGMEGNDRESLEIPVKDQLLLQKLCKVKKQNVKICCILNTCAPVDITLYEPNLNAIFCIFLPGMQGAKALADLLFGKRTPSGKLPISWPKRYVDTPTSLNFPGDGFEVTYGEGIYVGYRYYDKKNVTPLYPFGFGLSYTTFEIENVTTDRVEFNENITISGTIRNTGTYAGAEVVQLYVSDVMSTISKPVKELRRFKKIYLQPGEQKEFVFTLEEDDFSYYDMDYKCFLSEEGEYDLLIATSAGCDTCRWVKRVYLDVLSPYSYGLNSTIKVMYEQPQLIEALLSWWEKEGLDKGVLDCCYQYENSKKLLEVIPKEVDIKVDNNRRIRQFLEEIAMVKKK